MTLYEERKRERKRKRKLSDPAGVDANLDVYTRVREQDVARVFTVISFLRLSPQNYVGRLAVLAFFFLCVLSLYLFVTFSFCCGCFVDWDL